MSEYALSKPRVGVDVSKWQGKIKWDKLAPFIDFAIIRLGSGSNADENALLNQKACEENGIPYGVYWFSYADSAASARREASNCLSNLYGKQAYPVYFDYEAESLKGIDFAPEVFHEIASGFCEVVENAGCYAGIYTSTNFKAKFPHETFKRFDLWEANWSRDTTARMRQVWNKGRLPGVLGDIDLNLCYYDYPSLMKDKGFNGF